MFGRYCWVTILFKNGKTFKGRFKEFTIKNGNYAWTQTPGLFFGRNILMDMKLEDIVCISYKRGGFYLK